MGNKPLLTDLTRLSASGGRSESVRISWVKWNWQEARLKQPWEDCLKEPGSVAIVNPLKFVFERRSIGMWGRTVSILYRSDTLPVHIVGETLLHVFKMIHFMVYMSVALLHPPKSVSLRNFSR